MQLDPNLYDCDDCFEEALMDVGVYDHNLILPLDKLAEFNQHYKWEHENAHHILGLPVRK